MNTQQIERAIELHQSTLNGLSAQLTSLRDQAATIEARGWAGGIAEAAVPGEIARCEARRAELTAKLAELAGRLREAPIAQAYWESRERFMRDAAENHPDKPEHDRLTRRLTDLHAERQAIIDKGDQVNAMDGDRAGAILDQIAEAQVRLVDLARSIRSAQYEAVA